MAIGGVGLINTPVKITVKNGKVQNVSSADTKVLRRFINSLNTDEWSNIVGEFAFGIKSKARFVEDFLVSEPTVRVFNRDGSSINVLMNEAF